MKLLPMLNLIFHSKSTYWQSQFTREINAYNNFSLCETRFEDGKPFWSDNEARSDDLLSHSSLSLGGAMISAAHLRYPAGRSRLG